MSMHIMTAELSRQDILSFDQRVVDIRTLVRTNQSVHSDQATSYILVCYHFV
jgi:hypothetical protein